MIRFFEIEESSIKANYIKTIQILEKIKDKESKTQENKWRLRTQFNYYHVEIRAKDLNYHLNQNLQLGLGCPRIVEDFKNPKFDNQQRTELDFQFIQNQKIHYIDPENSYFDPIYSIIDHHKLYFDYAHGLSVNYGQSSVSKDVKIKSVHDYSTQTIFDINLNTGYCANRLETMKGDDFVVIDFNDPLSIIKNIPEVLTLDANGNNSYIGEFVTRNVACKVYETLFELKVDGENQKFIVSHYYAAYNFKLDAINKMPIRIDLRQLNDRLDNQKGYFVFLINKFYPALDFKQEIFDISNCMPNYNQYSWFLIEFDCEKEAIDRLKTAQLALIEAFKQQLSISSLRIPKILVDFDDTKIYFTTKLLEVPAIKNHFDRTINKKLEKPHFTYLSDEESCAKNCFAKYDCIAYSFCSNAVCSQLLLEDYGSDNKKTIPKDYVKMADDLNCNLQMRKFKLKRDDISSRDIRSVMSNLDKKVKSNQFILNVKLNENDEEEKMDLKASEIVMNVEPGSKQSYYLDNEKELDRSTMANNDQYFSLFNSNFKFDYDKFKNRDNKKDLLIRHTSLGLADCEIQCMNNMNCHSFSYCENKICIITSAFDTPTINDNIKSGIGCFISKSKF